MYVLFYHLHYVFFQFEEPRDIVDDNGDEAKPVENVDLSEEVNGTQEYGDEDGSTLKEIENEYGEEEEEHPVDVSIGKKILKFFTT